MLKKVIFLCVILALIIGSAIFYRGFKMKMMAGGGMPQMAEGGAPQAMPVSVAKALTREVVDWTEYSGRLQATADVQMRPRVSGTIDAVHFEEGDTVDVGQTLFTIDLRPFQARLSQAEAVLKGAQARLNLTSSDLKRAKSLLKEKAVSQREFDEKKNAHLEADAALQTAKAQLELAKLDVEYAEVRSPIKGRVGRPEITVGNTVNAGSDVLTTVQSIDPVYADFDMDEQAYLQVMKTVRTSQEGNNAMPVYMALADENEFVRSGKIKSFDNQLEGDSGTMRVRAEFENSDGILTPGLFARIRLGSPHKRNVVLVNDAAIGTDQDRKFVYVVDEKGTVAYRSVTTGKLYDNLRVVTSGVEKGDQVIVNGLMRVQPGMPVQPMIVSMETLQSDQSEQPAIKQQ